jgi:predicted amidohydrolase YtcJ
METTGGAAVWSKQRLRIEHGDGLMPDLIPRAKKLGLIVVQNQRTSRWENFGCGVWGRKEVRYLSHSVRYWMPVSLWSLRVMESLTHLC